MDSLGAGKETRKGKPRDIVIVGGTHGNEKGGVWAVRHLLEKPEDFPAPGLQVRGILANPEAIERNLRYLDRDLNRCFGPELAQATADHPQRERRRARELAGLIRPEGIAPDLVVDLHNTTANMGLTCILPSFSPWPLLLAWKASQLDPRVRILHAQETSQSNIFLPSLGKDEITLEIGPVAHGTQSHWAWEAADTTVRNLLATLGSLPDDFDPTAALSEARFEFFQTVSIERYPVGKDGRSRCLIHSNVQGRDYQPLADGDPLYFDPLEGTTLFHRGATVHPVFLGEAAYVESGISFHATRRLRWDGIQGVPC
ncbi:MAG TPA: aspartoacylase [Fibrobacteria bacterium]|nr:aspartoacylase [Fibrobacteria bacterium]HOX52556.1 aspartoacylase [Fibrobacteria bacterium]